MVDFVRITGLFIPSSAMECYQILPRLVSKLVSARIAVSLCEMDIYGVSLPWQGQGFPS
jgi:hypothetical protein